MLRKLQKRLMGLIVKPFLSQYLKKERSYRWKQFRVQVRPGVFHPGFFYSTRFLLHHLESLALRQRSFLELGAGTGLISIYAASRGAVVTASDINPGAVEGIIHNAWLNKVDVNVIRSDLFNEMAGMVFDIIVINPPYYKRQPKDARELAWFAGENLEYFSLLFRQIGQHIRAGSTVLMILSEDCSLEEIKALAADNGLATELESSRRIALEWNYIFRISKAPQPSGNRTAAGIKAGKS